MHGQSCSQVREQQSLRDLDIGRSHPKIWADTGSGQSPGGAALVAKHVGLRRPAPLLGQLQLSLSVYEIVT